MENSHKKNVHPVFRKAVSRHKNISFISIKDLFITIEWVSLRVTIKKKHIFNIHHMIVCHTMSFSFIQFYSWDFPLQRFHDEYVLVHKIPQNQKLCINQGGLSLRAVCVGASIWTGMTWNLAIENSLLKS